MSRVWWVPSLVVVALTGLGPLLAWTGGATPEGGFRLYFLGAILAALSAMGCAGAGAVASALGRPWRGSAVRAAIVPLVVTLGVMASTAGSVRWPYNDVTTDLEDPPTFASGEAAGVSYPAEFEASQREFFPDLEPLVLDTPVAETLRRAETVARGMGWTGVKTSAGEGTVQAVAISEVFRFHDDVVVRVRQQASGSRVDVRSRSRVGQSDLGANAARIREFLAKLSGS